MTPVDTHRAKRPRSEGSEGNGQRNLGEGKAGDKTRDRVSRLFGCSVNRPRRADPKAPLRCRRREPVRNVRYPHT